MPAPVVLVTGASSGVGAACARHLQARGFRVYGTSRRPGAGGSGFPLVAMDVDDEASVNACVAALLAREGRIDAVVNNAGFGIAGAVEDTSIEEARAQFETNVFGVMRVCRAVLPAMRAARSGHVVNVGSLAGLVAVPFQGLYSASKFALEGLTEALRMEVRPFGIQVTLVEPGDLSTGFTASRRRVARSGPPSAYRDAFLRALGVMEGEERGGPPPDVVAPVVERILRHPSPPLRHRIGRFEQRMAVTLEKLLPARAFEALVRRHYRV